jgi:excisionase family DNA binding protein
MDDLFSVEEAAAKLKLAPKTLRDWLRTGKLPAVKLGKRWLIRERDLEAAIEAHLRHASASPERTDGAGGQARRHPSQRAELQ